MPLACLTAPLARLLDAVAPRCAGCGRRVWPLDTVAAGEWRHWGCG